MTTEKAACFPQARGGLRSDLELTRRPSEQGVLVRDPLTNRIFAFSEHAFGLLDNLSPSLTPAENMARALGHEPTPELLAGMVSLVERARSAGLLKNTRTTGTVSTALSEGQTSYPPDWRHASTPSALPGGAATPAPAAAGSPNHWIRRLPNPFFIVIPLMDPQRLLSALRPVALPLFSRTVFALWAFFLTATIATLANNAEDYRSSFSLFRTTGSWTLLYFLLCLATVIHELGHALACERFGFRVKRLGLLIYFFSPGAYVDISGAWLLPTRTQRIIVSLAGVYLETYLWMALSWVWLATKQGDAIHIGAYIFSVVLALRIAFNLIPFLRLDGYWVLVDLLGISNLRAKSFHHLLSLLPMIGHYWTPPTKPASRDRVVLGVYGLASLSVLIFAVLAAAYKIRLGLVHLSPQHGQSCFMIACILVTALGLLKLWHELRKLIFTVKRG